MVVSPLEAALKKTQERGTDSKRDEASILSFGEVQGARHWMSGEETAHYSHVVHV